MKTNSLMGALLIMAVYAINCYWGIGRPLGYRIPKWVYPVSTLFLIVAVWLLILDFVIQ